MVNITTTEDYTLEDLGRILDDVAPEDFYTIFSTMDSYTPVELRQIQKEIEKVIEDIYTV